MNLRIVALILALGVVAALLFSPPKRSPAPPAAGSGGQASTAAASGLPARPETLAFKPLAFTPPEAASFRRVLPDGTAVYLAPSHEFPLVTVSITFKGGASLDPADVPGMDSSVKVPARE